MERQRQALIVELIIFYGESMPGAESFSFTPGLANPHAISDTCLCGLPVCASVGGLRQCPPWCHPPHPVAHRACESVSAPRRTWAPLARATAVGKMVW